MSRMGLWGRVIIYCIDPKCTIIKKNLLTCNVSSRKSYTSVSLTNCQLRLYLSRGLGVWVLSCSCLFFFPSLPVCCNMEIQFVITTQHDIMGCFFKVHWGFMSLFSGLCRLRTWRRSIQTTAAGSRTFSRSTTRRQRRSATHPSCTLSPFLSFRLLLFTSLVTLTVPPSFCLSLRVFFRFRTAVCACTPVREHLPWLRPPRCDRWIKKTPPCAALLVNKSNCTYSQLLVTARSSSSAKLNNLILFFCCCCFKIWC